MFTTVASYHDPIHAHIACGRLRAEGIDAHVADDQLGLANWEWRLAVGGTRVRVADDDATRARRVLSDLDAGEYALEGESSCAADLLEPSRESWSSRIAWIALMLFNVPLPWRRHPNERAIRKL